MLSSQIARELGVSRGFVLKVAKSADYCYKEYEIDKRTGGKRLIEHPSRRLKLLQRWIAQNIFTNFPVHPQVFSYRVGSSIAKHAREHVSRGFLLRLDLSNFFPSIRGEDVDGFLAKNRGEFGLRLDERDRKLVVNLVCRRNGLTIGAPSSPVISNCILYELDQRLSELVSVRDVKYSRYADDLYFSTSTANILSELRRDIEAIINQWESPKLAVNQDKVVFTSRKRRRIVTGVVLTSDGNLSIGRARKRYIKAMIYRLKKNELREGQLRELRGWLAFVNSVEPSFLYRLRRKYGALPILEFRE